LFEAMHGPSNTRCPTDAFLPLASDFQPRPAAIETKGPNVAAQNRRVIIKLVGAAIKLWLKSWREGRAFRRALKKIADSTTGIAIVAKKRLDGSKPPPNVTRQKGRHNTRLRRGQRVGRVVIGQSHKARSD
jgi:hypothetical protein